MEALRQEDDFGCAVACVAFVLGVTYKDALEYFKDGESRVKGKANFYFPEIVRILNSQGKKYRWKRLNGNFGEELRNDLSIVFVSKSERHPFGHFLACNQGKWMDPWINLPNREILAGYREELPGVPTHIAYPSVDIEWRDENLGCAS